MTWFLSGTEVLLEISVFKLSSISSVIGDIQNVLKEQHAKSYFTVQLKR